MQSELIFEPHSEPRPGVLVFPEAFGLGDHAIERAERLARLGYVALACDLHGGARSMSSLSEVVGLVTELRSDISRMRRRASDGFNMLIRRSEVDAKRVAAIGFCFGGTLALELARSGADVSATVGFHSGLATDAAAERQEIQSKVLVFIGADDAFIPVSERMRFEEEMRAGHVDWRMVLYGGVVHSFTNPQAGLAGSPEMLQYDPAADADSWATMCAFLKQSLDELPDAS